MDSGLLCFYVGLSTVTNVPLWWGMLTVGIIPEFRVDGKEGYACVWGREVFVPSPQYCCEFKTAFQKY